MLWYTYLYENTMFTNKWDAALFGKWKAVVEWKGNYRFALIKSLIYKRVWRGDSCGMRYERSIKVDQKCDLIGFTFWIASNVILLEHFFTSCLKIGGIFWAET